MIETFRRVVRLHTTTTPAFGRRKGFLGGTIKNGILIPQHAIVQPWLTYEDPTAGNNLSHKHTLSFNNFAVFGFIYNNSTTVFCTSSR